MRPSIHHYWDLTEEKARQIQAELAVKVKKKDSFKMIKFIAGVDVAYKKERGQLVAAIVVLNADSLKIVETATVCDYEQFSYIQAYSLFGNYHL